MTPERWQEVKKLLDQALQLKPVERCVFLDGACSSDHELRAEIASLLSEEECVRPKFLQCPPVLDNFNDNRDGERESEPGLSVGQVLDERFQLIRKLGEGGMGQVWLAEQTTPVRRTVAVKLIRAGMYDESVVKRFQAERQSLAIMDHPAIAKVFEAGTTAQGQPYFVMEYVPGLPISEYCDLKKLKIEERLELFIRACDGVQHAHQKAIIHRDLKPANILVVEVNGHPVPRIIDFGLARATVPQLGAQTLFTQVGQLVGTPGYMSPEQADPDVKDIDTRTDVYSLGAILYVLLAGSQPFDTKPGEKLPLDELLRRLREEDPPTPSTRVNSNRETSSATAEARGAEPTQLVKLLRGDLDWITMKALEKDRARRYGTPSELVADIHRYLRHEPVLARPAGVSYRIGKYARRHRVGVSVAAVVVLLLAGFSVLQAVQLRRITRERDRANLERDRANRITDILRDASPNKDAISMLERAVAIDPSYAPAWEHLGLRYYYDSAYADGGEQMLKRSDSAIERALALDPNLIDAAAQLALNRTVRGELISAYAGASDLVKRWPQNADGHFVLGYVLRYAGLLDEAARECDTALALDPGNYLRSCSWLFMELGQSQKATEFVRLDAGSEYAARQTAFILLRQGKLAEARQSIQKTSANPLMARVLIQFCLDPSQTVALEKAAQKAEAAALAGTDSEPRYGIGTVLAYCGVKDGAVRLLNSAIKQNYCAYNALQTDPSLAKLRGTAEFKELLSAAKECQNEFLEARSKASH